jgi:hypothetical protein
LPFEQIIVQAAHAALELGRQGLSPTSLDHPHLVLVGIDHEAKLRRTLAKIQNQGVTCVPFYEADRDNEMTAFATEPIFEDRRHIFRRFNCYKVPAGFT